MTRKRDRLMIIHDILKSVQNSRSGAKPTHILYRSNLSSQMLREYLAELMEKGLIRQGPGSRRYYVLTDKGHRFLQDFDIIRNFMESYGID